jgi:2-polyprenyl-6-methoxyphenol hydroxylase-like FAD-dependent oxidoreductase
VPEQNADVLIAGAGPVGLMLASELVLHGVRPLVLERLPEPTGRSKALGIIGRAVDVLDGRGLLPRFTARGMAAPLSTVHFSMIPLDPALIDGLGLRAVFIQQAATEQVLAEIAAERGVQVLRGREVTGLHQDDDGVTVQVTGLGPPPGEASLRARYLVGCDGGTSEVRKQAGIGFSGIPPTFLLRLGDVTLSDGLTPADLPDLRVPLVPLGGGYYRVVITEAYPDGLDRAAPMTLEELQAAIRRVNGADLPVSGARWLSRFTDSSRLADSYRDGRVLLAGDAAHIHLPAGGPGLNTGLLDAVNLAWKLAAQVHGWAPDGLLESYSAERRGEGERVLLQTRAQGALMGVGGNERIAALREVLRQLLQFPEPARHLVSLMYALDTRYDPRDGSAHPLAGRWVPEPGLADLLRTGRGVLLDRAADAGSAAAAQPWRDRLDIITAPVAGADPAALLIRPDGHLAWAGSPGDPAGLRRALGTWFGAPPSR